MASGIDKFMEDLSREYPRNVGLLGIDFKNMLASYIAGTLGGAGALLLNAAAQVVLQPFDIQEAVTDVQPTTRGYVNAQVGPVAADVQDALNRVEVVLVDPGDATPAGYANAIFIEKIVQIDDAVRYSTQDDLDTLSTVGYNSITNNNWKIVTDNGDRSTPRYLVFCGGSTAIENTTPSLSTVIRRDIASPGTGLQVSGAIHFNTVGWTSEFVRFFNNTTAGLGLRLDGATNKINLRDNVTTRYTTVFTVAAGDTVFYSAWQDTVSGTMYVKLWKNVGPQTSTTPTEDSGIQTGLGGSVDLDNVRWGFITSSASTSAILSPIDISKQILTDIGPPHVDDSTDLNANLLRRIREIEKTIVAARTADRAAFNANTTLAADGVLTVPVEAGKKYEVSGVVFYDSSTVADLKAQLDVPAGAVLSFVVTSLQSAAATSAATVNLQQRLAATSFVAGGVGVGTANTVGMPIKGTLIMGTTAGNLAWSFAQQTSDATDTVIRAGSYIKVREFV
jgi:hypothetical protein